MRYTNARKIFDNGREEICYKQENHKNHKTMKEIS